MDNTEGGRKLQSRENKQSEKRDTHTDTKTLTHSKTNQKTKQKSRRVVSYFGQKHSRIKSNPVQLEKQIKSKKKKKKSENKHAKDIS